MQAKDSSLSTEHKYLGALDFSKALATQGEAVVVGKQMDRFHIIRHGNQYFALDQMEYLGEGSFAEVYKGYPINTQGKLELSKPVTIKKFHSKFNEETINEEFALARFHHQMHAPLFDPKKKQFYLISEYLPGKALTSNEKLNQEIKALNFQERCLLLAALASDVQLTHESTSARGPSIIHLDFKPENILAKINRSEQGKFKSLIVNIIDFGLAKLSKVGLSKKEGKHWGTPSARAPEIEQGKISPKSDIYAMTGIAALVLGANDAYEEKINAGLDGDSPSQLDYKLSNLFSDVQLPKNLPVDLDKLIKQFLNHMQDQNIETRADDLVVLRFFTTAQKLALIVEQEAGEGYTAGNKSQDMTVCSTKLTLLANRLWNFKLSEKETFEQFDFDENLGKCQEILALEEQGKLTSTALKKLFNIEKKVTKPYNLMEFVRDNGIDTIEKVIADYTLSEILKTYGLANQNKFELTENWGVEKFNDVVSCLEKHAAGLIDANAGKQHNPGLFQLSPKQKILKFIERANEAELKSCRTEAQGQMAGQQISQLVF